MNTSNDQAFVFGCGYLGIRVARRLVSNGCAVLAMTRSAAKAEFLRAEGIQPIVGDWTDARCLAAVPAASLVLVAVGYDANDRRSREDVYVGGLRRALDVISDESNVVYVSSTGVYHQKGGEWVDESSPCRPSRGGGESHLRAEELLFRRRRGVSAGKTVVLRMAGLYGPGRIPRIDSLVRGEPVAAAPQTYLNLIQIDDAASCVLAAWSHPRPEPVYVVSDGNPVLRGDYFQEAANLVGAPSVKFQGQPNERSSGNKRIWTTKMRRDLLCNLQFPTYREGLRHALSVHRAAGGFSNSAVYP